MEHEKYMAAALELARSAGERGEIPVGCVIVMDRKIVGRGQNRREGKKNALAHAEIEAISDACSVLGGWRLGKCRLYVTLEPCPMCAGAIINARIPEIYFGASDPSSGACGSVINIFEERFGHRPLILGGIMERECSSLLSDFFQKLRKKV